MLFIGEVEGSIAFIALTIHNILYGYYLYAISCFESEFGHFFLFGVILHCQTLQGSTKPPIFRNFKELIIHGIKDTIVYAFYFTLMLIVSFLLISMIHSIPESSLIGIILAIIVIGFIFLLLFVSLINLAKHDGKLRYAFHFRELYSLLKRIGIGRIIIVYILAMLIEYLLIKTFITGENIPHMSFVAIIIRNLIVTPFLVIFTERTIALSAFNKI